MAIAATARPTSSGVPQRRIGVSPAAIFWSYSVADGLRHGGLDQTGTDLVDADPLPGQPNREELSDHAQARLGHAIFGP